MQQRDVDLALYEVRDNDTGEVLYVIEAAGPLEAARRAVSLEDQTMSLLRPRTLGVRLLEAEEVAMLGVRPHTDDCFYGTEVRAVIRH